MANPERIVIDDSRYANAPAHLKGSYSAYTYEYDLAVREYRKAHEQEVAALAESVYDMARRCDLPGIMNAISKVRHIAEEMPVADVHVRKDDQLQVEGEARHYRNKESDFITRGIMDAVGIALYYDLDDSCSCQCQPEPKEQS